MTLLLKYLASSVYTGFTIRESIEHIEAGDIKTLQIRALPRNNHVIDITNAKPIDWRYDSKPQFLLHNSLIVVSRGEPIAYLFKGDESDKVVVSNMSIVINLAYYDLLPEYLVWYINNASMAKQHFKLNARGANLALTTLSTVRELPVIIPSLNQQHQILQLEQEALAEKQAFEKLTQLRQEYNHAKSEQILTNTQSLIITQAV